MVHALFSAKLRGRERGEEWIPRGSRDDFRSKSSKSFAGSTLTRTKKKSFVGNGGTVKTFSFYRTFAYIFCSIRFVVFSIFLLFLFF